jgi:hypothetical protein
LPHKKSPLRLLYAEVAFFMLCADRLPDFFQKIF